VIDKPLTDFERGKEAGRVAQVLQEHSQHLAHINGSIDATGQRLAELADEMRGLREDARQREDRVNEAAKVLAKETERRRVNLADADRKFTRRERTMAMGVAVLGIAVAVLALLR